MDSLRYMRDGPVFKQHVWQMNSLLVKNLGINSKSPCNLLCQILALITFVAGSGKVTFYVIAERLKITVIVRRKRNVPAVLQKCADLVLRCPSWLPQVCVYDRHNMWGLLM